MHSGAVALLIDICTTVATAPVVSRDFWWFGGVVSKLDVTYLRPVKVRSTIKTDCEVLQIARRLATIRVVFKDTADGRILAVGEHYKASIEVVEHQIEIDTLGMESDGLFTSSDLSVQLEDVTPFPRKGAYPRVRADFFTTLRQVTGKGETIAAFEGVVVPPQRVEI